jgi:hypothetical protein
MAEQGSIMRCCAVMSTGPARIPLCVGRIGLLDPERDRIDYLNAAKGIYYVGEKLLVCGCMGT